MKKFVQTGRISFLEFSGPRPKLLTSLFDQMGFTKLGQHPDKLISLYGQGNIRFICNPSNGGNAERFRREHGRGVSAIAFTVENSRDALRTAVELGAKPADITDYDIPAIQGIGNLLIYLVDEDHERRLFASLGDRTTSCLEPFGLCDIDHVTHNLRVGGIQRWRSFYKAVFGFSSVRSFNITGQLTGLVSEVVASPNGNITIPLNESKDDKSQIAEFINEYNGEGVQHVALLSRNIYQSVELLASNGISFQDTPDTYYEMVDERIPHHGEDVSQLRESRILIDSEPEYGEGTLLQIFTKESIGPIFFEYIQRKGNRGFGNGNFQALFESIERDQQLRGVI
ncbi:MAG: 4-hydroxyphenylpyruvate dioxygenase [Cyanobacteria bacterium P01_A01_bin.3]